MMNKDSYVYTEGYENLHEKYLCIKSTCDFYHVGQWYDLFSFTSYDLFYLMVDADGNYYDRTGTEFIYIVNYRNKQIDKILNI